MRSYKVVQTVQQPYRRVAVLGAKLAKTSDADKCVQPYLRGLRHEGTTLEHLTLGKLSPTAVDKDPARGSFLIVQIPKDPLFWEKQYV